MAIQGLRTSDNFAANERPKNWREGILRLYPNGKAPLFGLTSAMKTRMVDDPEFNWWEKGLPSQRVALAANITTSTTDLTLASGALQMKAGTILYAEHTNELMRVVTDPTSDTTVTVTRGVAGTTATAITYAGAGVNPYLFMMGSSYPEGSAAPTGVNYDPTKRYNYTQIFRDTLEATRTALKTRLRTTDQAKEAKRECAEIHSVGIEKAMWFSKRYEGTLEGKPWRMMNGVMQQIDSGNIETASTQLDMDELEEFLYKIFKYGSSEKMGFGGNRAVLTLQQAVRKNSSMQIVSGIKEYGMNVSRLISPFGELVFKTHPLFNQIVGGSTGGTAYAGVESWLFVLDMANLQYVHLKDSDTKYEAMLQDTGVDGVKSGYLSELSMELHHPTSHYLIKNLIAAKVDS